MLRDYGKVLVTVLSIAVFTVSYQLTAGVIKTTQYVEHLVKSSQHVVVE